MNATNHNKDNLFAAIAVAVLLIGTASGNALIILALSAVLLLIGLLFFRPRMSSGPLRVVLVAAVVGIAVAAGLVFVLR